MAKWVVRVYNRLWWRSSNLTKIQAWTYVRSIAAKMPGQMKTVNKPRTLRQLTNRKSSQSKRKKDFENSQSASNPPTRRRPRKFKLVQTQDGRQHRFRTQMNPTIPPGLLVLDQETAISVQSLLEKCTTSGQALDRLDPLETKIRNTSTNFRS